jgi:hypothetical protein
MSSSLAVGSVSETKDKPIVVVVGITGMLGSKVVDELLHWDEVYFPSYYS